MILACSCNGVHGKVMSACVWVQTCTYNALENCQELFRLASRLCLRLAHAFDWMKLLALATKQINTV